MKRSSFHGSHRALILLLFAISLSVHAMRSASCLSMPPKQEFAKVDGLQMVAQDSSWDHVMGFEECEDQNEECLKRRMISEAHLDYIYTQQHRP